MLSFYMILTNMKVLVHCPSSYTLSFATLKRTWVNYNVENVSSLTLSLPHEDTVKETQWLTSDLKLADKSTLELLSRTSGLLHDIQLRVGGPW